MGDSMAELEPESLEMPEPESRHVRRRYGSKGGETVKSVQEVKSMTPIKSMNEIKSTLPVPDEIARRFINKHGLRSLTSSGGASPYEQEGLEEIARVPPVDAGGEALGRIMDAIGLLQEAVKLV